MKTIKVESFPNREIRVTLTSTPSARNKQLLELCFEEESAEHPQDPFLSFVQNSRTPKGLRENGNLEEELRPGWGGLPRQQPFSTYGRRQILRAGGALERRAPHKECLFLTVTLPGSTTEAMEAIARYSGMAVKLLHDWIGNHISSKLSLYTWELQKRGALHLHYVVHCPDSSRGEWLIAHLQEEWCRILDAICAKAKVDVYATTRGFSWKEKKEVVRVDAQWCEKSVAAYLSKYVSKAAKTNRNLARYSYYPSRWYGVSRPLLALLRSMTATVSIDSITSSKAWAMYEDCLSSLQSWAVRCYEYMHTVGGGKTIVSYSDENEQESIWNLIMTQTIPNPDSLSNTELNLRRLTRNGCILIKKHSIWLTSFMQFNGRSRPGNLLNSPSFKDLSRSDMLFLLDALAYSFRFTQRTRFELPGECKLWYSQVKATLDSAPSEDKEWIGALKL
jgi:hypothetical protein